jgi:serine phosphatase RsbU (regulator of sigma subunit)
MHKDHMVQFLALGLQLPQDHPDRNRYFSMQLRDRTVSYSDVAELTLMNKGDILFLYTDGVFDGSDQEERRQLEEVIRDHHAQTAKEVCNAALEHAIGQDDTRRQNGDVDLIDDKTVFIIKRT